MYRAERNREQLEIKGSTRFLKPCDLKEVTKSLKKNTYQIYKPYPASEKVIIYQKEKPEIILFEIQTKANLKHQDIMGAIFALKIAENIFGDIVLNDNHYYFYTFKIMQTFFENELKMIGKHQVTLKVQPLDTLKNYTPNFMEIEVLVKSLRLDAIIARLINESRDHVKILIKEKMITYNDEILKDGRKCPKENDVFAIRKYGKFIFGGILKTTKSDKLIISIRKYCDESEKIRYN